MSEAFRANIKPDMSEWESALEFEGSTEDADNTRLNKQHELKHEMECDVRLKRKEKCEQNLHKACAELRERCTTAMKAKLEAMTTFESVTCNNLIVIVKAIKEHSLCFEESRKEMVTIFDALKNHVNCKQKEQGKESLLDCTRRFKLSRKVLTSHWVDHLC